MESKQERRPRASEEAPTREGLGQSGHSGDGKGDNMALDIDDRPD